MQAQPYRKSSARSPSPVLAAMRRGRAMHRRNPMDSRRLAAKRRHRFARALTKR